MRLNARMFKSEEEIVQKAPPELMVIKIDRSDRWNQVWLLLGGKENPHLHPHRSFVKTFSQVVW